MKFEELDDRMRVFETAHDHCVLPGMFMVARLDGRSFTRLTKELHAFDAPFDERVRDLMVATTEHVMDCGFRVVYGFTQSDEISLLFHPDENAFGRKLRKFNSVLAGEASAKFSLLLGDVAAFDSRISQLPTLGHVLDYFSWRGEDAHRNALNGHCYWTLRREGQDPREATQTLAGMSVADKNELLFQRAGVNFNDLPRWQKRGTGIYWERYEVEGLNPVTAEVAMATRRRLRRDFTLPSGEQYGELISELVRQAG